MMILAKEQRDASFFPTHFGLEVKDETVCEKRVGLASTDEGDAAGPGGVAVKTG
jgi:hypothetical protein